MNLVRMMKMKFDYEGKPEVKKECVAVLHNNGTLIIELQSGCIAIGEDESGKFYEGESVEFWEGQARKKFYPGDKVTITF